MTGTYYPKIGVVPASKPFAGQFPHVRWNYVSFATTPIELLSLDGSGETVFRATGFFCLYKERCYLGTAAHVFSGRDSFTGTQMSSVAYVPERIRVFPTFNNSQVGHAERQSLELDLASEGRTPLWKVDPEFESFRTDIALLDVTSKVQPLADIVALDREPSLELIAFVGQNVSVVGYPTPNYTSPYPPVWRRGSFATEPGLFVDGRPMFLIDAATSSGMSGSPVIQMHVGPAPVSDGNGGVTVMADAILTMKFVGVYAGRFSNTHPAGELAYAFFANRLAEIADGQKFGIV